MKKSKTLKTITTVIVVALALALVAIFAGCDLIDALITQLPTDQLVSNGSLITTSNARGTSLSLSSDGLEISRAQLTKEAPMGEEGTRTVLIYLCGTDLESDREGGGLAVADLKEMVSATDNAELNVLVQTGGAKKWSDSDISAKKITRYKVTSTGLVEIETLPQANMGAASTLADFLVWGVTEYPAEKIDVIFWNHGSGSINGVCFDENYDYDSLSVSELDEAFLAAFSQMTGKFESVGFDACLMSTIEVANVLASYSNYMIASEESEAGTGWAYKTVLNALAEDPTLSGAELGKVVADSAYKSLTRDNKKMFTTSVIDLSKVDAICKAFDAAAEDMSAYVDENSTADIVKLIKQALNFGGNSRSEGYTNMVDLGDMMNKVSTLVPSCAEVVEAINEAIVYKVNGNAVSNASGIAVYYPLKLQGSTEVAIFTNICVSPHYLAYLDKTVFGTSASSGNNNGDQSGNNTGNSHNWQQWIQNDFDFWSLVNSFSDYWNDLPDTQNNDSYNVLEPENDEVTLQLLTDPYLDSNGTYTVKISGESLNNLVTVDYALFKKGENGAKILIGSDIDVKMEYRNGVCTMTDQFNGKWIALSDGQLLALEVTEETAEYAIYSAPAILNGTRVTIRVKRLADEREYEVLGVYNGISESGAASKSMTGIQAGDVLIPVYYVYQEDNSITESQGNALTIGEDGLVLEEVALSDGDYEYCFILTDILGEAYYTDATVYTIEGDTIYYTSQKTDNEESSIWDIFQNPFGFNFYDFTTGYGNSNNGHGSSNNGHGHGHAGYQGYYFSGSEQANTSMHSNEQTFVQPYIQQDIQTEEPVIQSETQQGAQPEDQFSMNPAAQYAPQTQSDNFNGYTIQFGNGSFIIHFGNRA